MKITSAAALPVSLMLTIADRAAESTAPQPTNLDVPSGPRALSDAEMDRVSGGADRARFTEVVLATTPYKSANNEHAPVVSYSFGVSMAF